MKSEPHRLAAGLAEAVQTVLEQQRQVAQQEPALRPGPVVLLELVRPRAAQEPVQERLESREYQTVFAEDSAVAEQRLQIHTARR